MHYVLSALAMKWTVVAGVLLSPSSRNLQTGFSWVSSNAIVVLRKQPVLLILTVDHTGNREPFLAPLSCPLPASHPGSPCKSWTGIIHTHFCEQPPASTRTPGKTVKRRTCTILCDPSVWRDAPNYLHRRERLPCKKVAGWTWQNISWNKKFWPSFNLRGWVLYHWLQSPLQTSIPRLFSPLLFVLPGGSWKPALRTEEEIPFAFQMSK